MKMLMLIFLLICPSISLSVECEPATCQYNNQTGYCLSPPAPNYIKVGVRGCKGGCYHRCLCYIEVISSPPVETEPSVIIATSENFDDVVTNSDRDALVEFYAPWCPGCQAFAPVLDKLGEIMKDEAVDIIKMDVIAHTPPSPYKVYGYPQINWRPAGGDPIVRNNLDGLELKDLIKFIARSSTNELKGFDRNGNPKN